LKLIVGLGNPGDKQHLASGVKLIVGLGNPGYQYHRTPHNLGFMAADRLAEDAGVSFSRREAQAAVAATEIAGVPVLIAKPETFMNLSGLSVARLFERHGLVTEDLIVLVDEVELPLGSIRIRARGSAGGHNGLKSIIGALGEDGFARVRMGVGPDHRVEDRVSYVLAPFRKGDLEAVAEMIEQAAEAVRVILSEGIQKAMNRFNRRASPPET
jgi:peptidyl-tRNA hydrolase, PTH1 family